MGTFIQINANKNIQTANNSSFSKESVEQKQTTKQKHIKHSSIVPHSYKYNSLWKYNKCSIEVLYVKLTEWFLNCSLCRLLRRETWTSFRLELKVCLCHVDGPGKLLPLGFIVDFLYRYLHVFTPE